MTKTVQQTVEFDNVSPEDLFEIYIDSKKHSAAIGAPASVSRRVGGEFKAFGEGHVRGRNLAIVPERMIVQSWRGEPWKKNDLDSILVLSFSKTPKGAKVDLVQANIPDDAYTRVNEEAWVKLYWEPWKSYLKIRSRTGTIAVV